jgi:hypothetical protein
MTRIKLTPGINKDSNVDKGTPAAIETKHFDFNSSSDKVRANSVSTVLITAGFKLIVIKIR